MKGVGGYLLLGEWDYSSTKVTTECCLLPFVSIVCAFPSPKKVQMLLRHGSPAPFPRLGFRFSA